MPFGCCPVLWVQLREGIANAAVGDALVAQGAHSPDSRRVLEVGCLVACSVGLQMDQLLEAYEHMRVEEEEEGPVGREAPFRMGVVEQELECWNYLVDLVIQVAWFHGDGAACVADLV